MIRSSNVRKCVESPPKWMKTVVGFRRGRYTRVDRTELCGELVAAAYNLVRMSSVIVKMES